MVALEGGAVFLWARYLWSAGYGFAGAKFGRTCANYRLVVDGRALAGYLGGEAVELKYTCQTRNACNLCPPEHSRVPLGTPSMHTSCRQPAGLRYSTGVSRPQENVHLPLGPPLDPGHMPTAGSEGVATPEHTHQLVYPAGMRYRGTLPIRSASP